MKTALLLGLWLPLLACSGQGKTKSSNSAKAGDLTTDSGDNDITTDKAESHSAKDAPDANLCADLPNPSDADHPADAAIQACLDKAPVGGTITLPAKTYYLAAGIRITKGVRLTTSKNSDKPCYTRDASGATISLNNDVCATLKATSTLVPSGSDFLSSAMIGIGSPANVDPITKASLDHLIIDGSRDDRTANNVANCGSKSCHSIHIYRCDACSLIGIVSAHAMQGYNTVAIDTDGLIVQKNLFWDNGVTPYVNSPGTHYRGAGPGFWSNAFEIQANNRSIANVSVQDNDVIDASDGGLCFSAAGLSGTTIAGDVSNNYIAQVKNQNWQAIVLWDTNNGASPNAPLTTFGNAGVEDPKVTLTIHDNTINCDAASSGKRLCTFGIQIGGQHEVQPDGHLVGARVRNNLVQNARIGINVDGAGIPVANDTVNQWIHIVANSVLNSGIAFNKAPETNDPRLNQQFNAIAAEDIDGAGRQIAGSEGFWGGNLAPKGWTTYDTSLLCANPSTGVMEPGVFGNCSWFPAP